MNSGYFKPEIPEKCGVSSEWITDLATELTKQLPDQVPHGWALIRHGKLLAKAVYKPFDGTTPQMVCSVSKSLVSTAIGFCVQEGLITIKDRISDYFPDKMPSNPSDEMRNLTVEEMLCMGAGAQGTPVHETGEKPGDDRIKDFFATPIVHKPGTVFGYDGAVTHTLAALVNRVTGKDIMDYLNERFFKKLDMPVPPVPRYAKSGLIWGDSGMRFTQEQIAKIGQFYLNEGKWNGEQILNADWCRLATSKHIGTENCGTGLDWQQGYCFQLWRGRYNTFRFCGAYAQFCIVMPDLDALFIYQSGTDNDKIQWVVPIFYDTVMHRMKSDVDMLPANPRAYKKMKQTLDSLKVNAVYSEKSPLEERISGMEFTPGEESRIKKISMRFEKDKMHVECDVIDGTHLSFPCGRRDFAVSSQVIDSSFCHMDDCDHSKYASVFCWEQPNHLIITSHLLASMTMLKIEARFNRDGNEFRLRTIRGKYDK